MNAIQAVHLILKKTFYLNHDFNFRCWLEQNESLRNWVQTGKAGGAPWMNRACRKKVRAKWKNSSPRILTEMQRTELNKNNEETRLINEQMAWSESPCVKSTVMNAGNDVCLGQDKPRCFGNMGTWEEWYPSFTAAPMSQTYTTSMPCLCNTRDMLVWGNVPAVPATAFPQVPSTRMCHEADDDMVNPSVSVLVLLSHQVCWPNDRESGETSMATAPGRWQYITLTTRTPLVRMVSGGPELGNRKKNTFLIIQYNYIIINEPQPLAYF